MSVTGLGILLACLIITVVICAPIAWRGLKKRNGRTAAPAEDDAPPAQCGYALMIMAQSKRFQALSGDLHACLEAVTRFVEEQPSRPVGDPGAWIALRTRLVALAVELEALDFALPLPFLPHPPLPRADKIVLADLVRWRDYLTHLAPRAERGDVLGLRSRIESARPH